MTSSWTTLVQKRNGGEEPFDVHKLAGAIARAMIAVDGAPGEARELAGAIQVFLRRSRRKTISSAAIFEMTLKTLRQVRRSEVAELLELHRTLRTIRRDQLRVVHGRGRSRWEKTWLAQLAMRIWGLSPMAARLLAGEVEADLIHPARTEVAREEVLDRMNEKVCQYGLADAVPVRQ
jgi:ABC-type cobalamin transport system ATPase subunit